MRDLIAWVLLVLSLCNTWATAELQRQGRHGLLQQNIGQPSTLAFPTDDAQVAYTGTDEGAITALNLTTGSFGMPQIVGPPPNWLANAYRFTACSTWLLGNLDLLFNSLQSSIHFTLSVAFLFRILSSFM